MSTSASSKFTSLRGWTKEEDEDEEEDEGDEEGRELLFCMPREVDSESLMWLPCHVGVLLPNSPTIRILWEESVHGTEWTKCYLGEREDDS